jgi:hypothetical protein
MSKAGLAIAGVVAMLGTLFAPAPPASAATVYLHVMALHCNDQSEPFSDEIRLRFNGEYIGGWNNVDGGETYHWDRSFPIPRNRAFSGRLTLDVMEEDGQDRALVGYIWVDESEVDAGEIVRTTIRIDGSYWIRYYVSST